MQPHLTASPAPVRRFLPSALADLAAAHGLTHEQRSGGWIQLIGGDERRLAVMGYQFDVNGSVAAALARDKAAAALLLGDGGVACVPTELVLDEIRQTWTDGTTPRDALEAALERTGLPAVVKPNEGSSGRGVAVARSLDAAWAHAEALLATVPSVAVQPLLDLTSEQRCVLFEGAPLLWYRKEATSSIDGMATFNLSLDACVAEWREGDAPDDVLALARSAVDALGLRLAAVDVVTTATGDLLVLEVNSGLSFEHFVRPGVASRPDGTDDAAERRAAAQRAYERIVLAAVTVPPPTPWLDGAGLPQARGDVAALLAELPSLGPKVFREEAGLASAKALFGALGDPQEALPIVHVAGTAGKGTVATALATALAGGGRVGLHVSPHVYDLGERMQVDRVAADSEVLVDLARSVLPAVRHQRTTEHGTPTFFEVTVAMAFERFATAGCDLAVVEVGLGGLLDTTNAVERADKLAIITRLGLDHQLQLGDTLAEIAAQKAGILPWGGEAVVLRPEDPGAWTAIERTARERGCTLHVVEPDPSAPVPHLAEDEALVRRALEVLAGRDQRWRDLEVPALAELALPGRFELVEVPGGTAILDGAHNGLKLRALLERVEARYPGRRLPWLFGCKQDKDEAEMLALLAARASALCFTEFDIPAGDAPASASRRAAELAARAAEVGGGAPITVLADVADAARWAAEAARTEGVVVVAGSFYLLRPVKAALAALAAPPTSDGQDR